MTEKELRSYGPRGFLLKSRLCAASVVFALVMIGANPVSAQGSNAEQLCTPDVMRLCSEFIPDRGRIVACMKAKRSQLSGPCRAAVSPGKFAKAKRHDGHRKKKLRARPRN